MYNFEHSAQVKFIIPVTCDFVCGKCYGRDLSTRLVYYHLGAIVVPCDSLAGF